MKSTMMTVVVAAAAVLGVVGIVSVSRYTQADQARADAEASLHTAKAMRVLAKYRANVAQIAMLREQIGRQLGSGQDAVPVPPTGGDVEEVVREPSVLDEFKELSREFRSRAKRTDELEERIRRLVPDVSDIGEPPRTDLGQNEATIVKGIANARKQVDRLTKDNAGLLAEALQEANAALRVQHGEAGTQDHVNASHLKACILHVQGEVKRNEALAGMAEATRARMEALQWVDRSSRLLSRIEDARNRAPKQFLERLAKDKADLAKRLAATQQRVTELTGKVEAQRKAIAAAQGEAQTVGKSLQALEQKGFDPKKPADVKRYVNDYTKQAALQRDAGLKAQALKTGTLEGAKLGDEHGGDLLKDRYLVAPGAKQITVVKGLDTLEKDLTEAKQTVADAEALVAANVARTQQVGVLGEQLDKLRGELTGRKKTVDEQVAAKLAEIDAVSESVPKAEEAALGLLEKAGDAYKQAARAARGRGGEVLDQPGMEDMPDDKDSEAAMDMGRASVGESRAMVYLRRMGDLEQHRSVLRAALDAQVPGVKEDRIEQAGKAQAEARQAAVEAIDGAIELMEKSRAIKGINKNYKWLPQVSTASAYRLKSLLVSGSASADALAEAVALYDEALEEREGSPFLKPYVLVAGRVRELSAAMPATSQPTTDKPTATGAAPAALGAKAGPASFAKLSAALKSAAKPGKLDKRARAELETLIRTILPETAGDLAGYEWEVSYADLDENDFFNLNLVKPGAERAMWFHVFYAPDRPDKEKKSYGAEAFGKYRGMGAKDRHYFALIGNVEIRAVGSSKAFQNDAKIKRVLIAFKLDEIAKL